MEKKQELAGRAYSVKEKGSPQAIAKQWSSSLFNDHRVVSVLQPCPCSCSTVVRDIRLWRWATVRLGVAVVPQCAGRDD